MKANQIQTIVSASRCQVVSPDLAVEHLLTDSRRLGSPEGTLFFAIPTRRNSGTRYVDELYRAGVRSFVLPANFDCSYPDANLWWVDDVVRALQLVAAAHRRQFHIPVVGITGSNGKTVVKDWLVQLLGADRRVVASPKSYNSQIGVPLSVWQMAPQHDIAIFEAGISQPGEMEALQNVIQPTIGILTNIRQAHDENFTSRQQKADEKTKLFLHCQTVICSEEYAPFITDDRLRSHLFVWGKGPQCDMRLLSVETLDGQSRITLADGLAVTIPFTDRASQENALHCIALMHILGCQPQEIVSRCAHLSPVEMRLEIIEGTGNSLLINDSYSLDTASLDIALDLLLQQRQHDKRTVVISDIPQSGVPETELYDSVARTIQQRGIQTFIGIGPALLRCQSAFAAIPRTAFYPSTDDFLRHLDPADFRSQTILLKGARAYSFERIAHQLQQRSHETLMEVNLDALIHNLNYFRSRLNPGTRLMAMVKASSYGAGTVQVATALQHNHVDYLTVAYIDEGVELRRNGITLPIMVMNPEPAGFDQIIRYRLEPDIYSFPILERFSSAYSQLVQGASSAYPIHIEFDTGMHRLGFSGDDLPQLLQRLDQLRGLVEVKSVFSHLACSEDPAMDDFTRLQITRLQQWGAPFHCIKHILNSSGISRFPEAQMDMVRLGIGLYGIAPEPDVQRNLRQVSRLVTRISQIKAIPAGDTVGYNRRWQASRPSRIAILPVGYADGLSRHLGNGNGRVAIAGLEAPIIGSVCMDMCFVDVTDIPCREGDRAVLFGEGDLLQRNAAAAGTIPYEMLTAVSPRVKRVYYHEE